MDIAKCLTVIESLCAREFPTAHGSTERGESGPGFHIAALRTSGDFWDGDAADREDAAAQYEADRDGLTELLTGRWGPPQCFSLRGVFLRTLEGEEIDEPWAGLSEHVPDVHLWQAPVPGRWFALGVSQGYEELPFQLLGIVTEIDPP
ncbi:hypothetical protein ACH47Z_31720 [Streptomyces sp. NPDC020192]|uniref:hypothetical protein n=1 Tax=Streptomyces sp. NPDC020192 TaxID=3365066 RepID=UPI0037957272